MKHPRKTGQSRRFSLVPLAIALLLPTLSGILWLVLFPHASNSHPGHTKRVTVEDLPQPLVLFDSVFWEPLDTTSLRQLLRETPDFVAGKSVLDIGTGSGLLALCCRRYGAARVVAVDVNPNAVACARYNAKRLGLALDVRLAKTHQGDTIPTAFSAIQADERFDRILSNPPWEDGKPAAWSDYALYDPDFRLLRSLLQEARQHLNPGGKILLAYGCVEAIQSVHQLAGELDYELVVLDERDLDSLPPVFLPGMLLGLTPRSAAEH